MALSADTVWEVRSGGSDTNGGGWTAGSTGTDWTQQDAAQYSVTDAGTSGTTSVSSASANFGTDVVGNVLYIQGGTGSITAGWYRIVSRTSSTIIVVDRSTGLTAGTGATLKIGGALATLATLNSVMIANNKAYIKGTTFTQSANVTFTQSATPNGSTAYNRLIGYTTTRSDQGRARITLQTNTGLTGIKTTGNGWSIENIEIDCNSLGTSVGIDQTGTFCKRSNCKVSNFTSYGMKIGQVEACLYCEITGGTSAASAGIYTTDTAHIAFNWVHNNACTGIQSGLGAFIIGNICANNTGASSDGIQHSYKCAVLNNTCHGNGRDGIRNTTAFPISLTILNNILTSNGAYGLSCTTSNPADRNYDGNAFWNNTSGTRQNYDNVSGIYAVNPYTNVYDKTLTGNPYTASGSNDFTLNNTSGAGAACRGAALPTSVGSTTTNTQDMGASQSAPSGGGGGGSFAFTFIA